MLRHKTPRILFERPVMALWYLLSLRGHRSEFVAHLLVCSSESRESWTHVHFGYVPNLEKIESSSVAAFCNVAVRKYSISSSFRLHRHVDLAVVKFKINMKLYYRKAPDMHYSVLYDLARRLVMRSIG